MAPQRKKSTFAKRVGRVVKRRYFRGRGFGKPNLSTMAKDVSMLKGLINAEKKRLLQNSSTTQTIGQVSGNNSGYYALDFTPQIAEGVTYNTRNGSSVKWTSSYLQFQMSHQSSTVARVRYEIHIVKVLGTTFANIATLVSQYLTPNQFIYNQNGGAASIYDLASSRNQDYFKNFRCLRKIKGSLEPDNISSQPVIKTFSIGMKYQDHHIKYNLDTTTVTNGQVVILIFTDSGNTSGSTACTLQGVPSTAVNTGLLYNYNFTHYFVDN